ncbi:DUF502 domain-containing protein [Candidatus Nanohalococcus occultus]|uniref:Membrane protein n=1 Tax=Candidatus Nanohalococcus occultus TaxID=2978047 RepID=A0ABY8CCW9_9ARCH|nr:putative membrane protein [Candidatus Nanohaloarchaeota archaeon SVXNc]
MKNSFNSLKTSIDTSSHTVSSVGNFKRLAVVGIIVLTPLAANFLLASWLLQIVGSIPGNEFFQITPYPVLNHLIKGSLIVVLGSVLIIGTGKLFSTRKGSMLESRMDLIFLQIPLISSVYTITKTAADTVFRKKDDFKHPVKIDFNGVQFTGFQTGNCSKDGRKVVFVPTAPNITSGFVVEVTEDQLVKTDETLEDALKRILSAGFSN